MLSICILMDKNCRRKSNLQFKPIKMQIGRFFFLRSVRRRPFWDAQQFDGYENPL